MAIDNHEGFVHSLVDTIRHELLIHQHSEWSNICKISRGENSDTPAATLSSKIHNSKILVIPGDADGIVVADGVSEDLGQILGPEEVELRTVAGGRVFLFPAALEVIKHILDLWDLTRSIR